MPRMSAHPIMHLDQQLHESQFKIHALSQIPLHKKEPIADYSKQMTEFIHHHNPILTGVSLGGLIVQEMQKHIKVRQVIIISSIKNKYELPKFMRFGRKTKLYKLLPTGLAKHYSVLLKLQIERAHV